MTALPDCPYIGPEGRFYGPRCTACIDHNGYGVPCLLTLNAELCPEGWR